MPGGMKTHYGKEYDGEFHIPLGKGKMGIPQGCKVSLHRREQFDKDLAGTNHLYEINLKFRVLHRDEAVHMAGMLSRQFKQDHEQS